jgi:hypothetical protein
MYTKKEVAVQISKRRYYWFIQRRGGTIASPFFGQKTIFLYFENIISPSQRTSRCRNWFTSPLEAKVRIDNNLHFFTRFYTKTRHADLSTTTFSPYFLRFFTTLFYSKLRPTFEPDYSTLEQTSFFQNSFVQKGTYRD